MPTVTIDTPQNVPIAFEAASVGQRIGARLLDVFIQYFYVIIVMIVVFGSFNRPSGIDWLFLFLLMLPVIVYTPMFEFIWNGQTPGKRAVNIRVIRTDGSPAHFIDYMQRWLLMLIEVVMTQGVLAIVVIISGGRGQRLGDIVAGTTVINQKTTNKVRKSFMREVKDDYQPKFKEVQVLNDRDMNTIDGVMRKHKVRSSKVLVRKLVKRLFKVMNVDTKDPRTEGMSAEKFVETVIKDYNYYSGKV